MAYNPKPNTEIYIVFSPGNTSKSNEDRASDDPECYELYTNASNIPEGREVYVYNHSRTGKIEPRKLVLEDKR